MLNIELAVLQTLDQEDWWTTSEISERTRIQEQSAADALYDPNKSGIVEARATGEGSDSRPEIMEWRSPDHTLENYLKDMVPEFSF